VNFGFNLQITLWLWFTVLFANFAEAMAEGRGKAQADTLRKARSETIANRLVEGGRTEQVPSSKLRAGLVFFHNGESFSDVQLDSAPDVDTKNHIASFRVELPLEKFPVGRYAVQVIAVSTDGEQVAFGRNYFAVRTPPAGAGGSSGGTSK
jgi:hypothetical protein